MAAGEQIIDYSIWPTVATSRTIDKRALPCRCQRTQRTAGGLWCGGMTFLFFAASLSLGTITWLYRLPRGEFY